MLVDPDADRATLDVRRLDLERELTRITGEADRSAHA
jgi:hypothetical protein